MITYQPGKGVEYFYPTVLSAEEKAVLVYAASVFGFLLTDWRNKPKSWGEFADLIRRSHAATPRTTAILAIMERTSCLAETDTVGVGLRGFASEADAQIGRGRGARSVRRARKTNRSRTSARG